MENIYFHCCEKNTKQSAQLSHRMKNFNKNGRKCAQQLSELVVSSGNKCSWLQKKHIYSIMEASLVSRMWSVRIQGMDISMGNWILRPMVSSRKNSLNHSWERSQHCCKVSEGKRGEMEEGYIRVSFQKPSGASSSGWWWYLSFAEQNDLSFRLWLPECVSDVMCVSRLHFLNRASKSCTWSYECSKIMTFQSKPSNPRNVHSVMAKFCRK